MQSLPVSSIGFFTSVFGAGTNMGYGYAAVELIKAWQRQNIPVWAMDTDAPVAFSFCQPHFYEPVEGAFNIGYTPWESTKVPEKWPFYMEKMDEIWTTCEANARWYREVGLSVPVRVLHHGINREHYPVRRRYIKPGECFRFLHVGEPSPRKGGEFVYNVFKETFGDDERVSLTLKGKPRFDIVGDNVKVIAEHYDQSQMTELYLNHHAFVYPTNGEGFGFCPFQAAATGMPTAVTNWSGPEDFMKFCYPISVHQMIEPTYEPHEGLWAEPSETSLAYWMTSFFDSSSYFFNKSFRLAQQMDRYWTWDNIAKISLQWMNDFLIAH